MKEKGFYIVAAIHDEFILGAGLVYEPTEKWFQISVILGFFTCGAGYQF